ncbi:hypothetical protein B0T26DRAFT_683029 [Lasiosphaeria miniovina]|uniref:MYND-type domain-containing protein n=1 Tax=Lasiosphaeria miniovina TaxID=1954250 RepID=A0AA40BFA6_9PEZI|nr:uncharacterized protein B0T26DRAFT_683029 [Lasiosphaeria miniovina]KAK0733167.1 hypothetical protein B0T26DRAFT_683029 [Lasiosphaeria miniovina]
MEKHFTHMIPKQCEICEAKEGLLRCAGCSTYYFCGRAHQREYWPTHKSTCNTIKNAKQVADDMEAKIRADGYYDHVPTAAFSDDPRRRMYIRARLTHAEMLIRSWRHQGIEDALTICQALVRLDRVDRESCRDLVPALLLRLGRDQECYDFCKWWQAVACDDSDYNPRDATLPFLDIKDADATEPADLWKGERFLRVTHLGTLQLLKMRLFRGLQLAQRCRATTPGLSAAEILTRIRSEYRGDILERRPELVADDATLNECATRVNESLADLLHSITATNKNYLIMLVSPTQEDFQANTHKYVPGSEEEARLAFSNTYNAWVESPGAIEQLRKVLDVIVKAGTE